MLLGPLSRDRWLSYIDLCKQARLCWCIVRNPPHQNISLQAYSTTHQQTRAAECAPLRVTHDCGFSSVSHRPRRRSALVNQSHQEKKERNVGSELGENITAMLAKAYLEESPLHLNGQLLAKPLTPLQSW